MEFIVSALKDIFHQPKVSAEFENEFRQAAILSNCRRLKSITWVVLLTLVVFLFADIILLDRDVMDGVWEFLIGARMAGLAFCLISFALFGPLRDENDLKPYHGVFWQVFVGFYVVYGALVVGYLFPYKGDVGPFYVFLICPYAFLCWRRAQAIFMLLVSMVSISLSIYFLVPDLSMVRFQLINASIVAWASFVITHLTYRAYYRDFMNRKLIGRKNELLEEARSKAESGSQAKTYFMTAMSHEIRTPMNSILGMTEVALHSGLTREQQEYIEAAHESGLHLMDIVNELLDFSRIESGRLRLISAHFDLVAVVESAMKTVRLQAEGKGVELQFKMMEDVPRYLKGDPGRVRQVLVNLLSNGVDFTDEGFVRITVTSLEGHGDAKAPVGLRFAVKDSGVGIESGKLESIFEVFADCDRPSVRSYGGCGLGLAISRNLVRLMGGDISVSSRRGHGSEFVFTAAFSLGDSERASDSDTLATLRSVQLPVKPSKVLLVDDNQLNIKVTRLHLDRMNMKTHVAESGAEALLLLAEEEFDLVLMDLEMPGMDGYETTRRIRSGEGAGKPVLQPDIPILAVTAHALAEVRTRCGDMGMNGFVSKPVGSGELGAAMRRILGGDWRRPATGDNERKQEAPVLDLERAARHLGVSMPEMKLLVSKAMEEIAVKFSLAQKGVQSGILKEVALQAHTLKSVSASIGAEATRRAAVKLEDASRREEVGLSAKRLGELSVEIARLESAVGALPTL